MASCCKMSLSNSNTGWKGTCLNNRPSFKSRLFLLKDYRCFTCLVIIFLFETIIGIRDNNVTADSLMHTPHQINNVLNLIFLVLWLHIHILNWVELITKAFIDRIICNQVWWIMHHFCPKFGHYCYDAMDHNYTYSVSTSYRFWYGCMPYHFINFLSCFSYLVLLLSAGRTHI